jgi:hypothetical protein
VGVIQDLETGIIQKVDEWPDCDNQRQFGSQAKALPELQIVEHFKEHNHDGHK